MRRWPTWGKTIVFAGAKRHAETLAALPDEHFVDWKRHPATRYADFLVSDVGGGPVPDATAIIKRSQGKGVSEDPGQSQHARHRLRLPRRWSVSSLARSTTSTTLYRQMRGRGPRKAPHIGKADFTIFDFVGVTEFVRVDFGSCARGNVGIAARLTSARLSPQGQGRRQRRGSVA